MITKKNPFEDKRVDSSEFPKMHKVARIERNPPKRQRTPTLPPEKLPLLNEEGLVAIRFFRKETAPKTVRKHEKIYIKPELYRLLRELCSSPNNEGEFYELNLLFDRFTVRHSDNRYNND